MLVKSEPEDFSMSLAEITDLETAIFRKELFENALPSSMETGSDDDFLSSFSHDVSGYGEAGEPWCSPVHSSSSSSRSSSTIDDKLDVFEQLPPSIHLPDEYNELADFLTTASNTELSQVALTEQQLCGIPEQDSVFGSALNSSLQLSLCSTSSNDSSASSLFYSNDSNCSNTNSNGGTSVTNINNSSSLVSNISTVNGTSPTLFTIKTEEFSMPDATSPLSNTWRQLLSDNCTSNITHSVAASNNNNIPNVFPKFKIIKTEPKCNSMNTPLNIASIRGNNNNRTAANVITSIKSSPIYNTSNVCLSNTNGSNIVISTISSGSSNGVGSIKTSPPSSPITVYSSHTFSPSPPHSQPVSPQPVISAVTPRYRVLSITSNKGASSDALSSLVSRSTSGGAITKTKKIQPKVSVRTISQAVSSTGVLGLVNTNSTGLHQQQISPNGTLMGLVNNNGNISTLSSGAAKPIVTSMTASVASRLGVSSLSSCPPLLPNTTNSNTSNSMVLSHQVKVLKRHERMIKNRESASLSRKKKKEYVTNLENEMGTIKDENVSLKQEVCSLNNLVSELRQECNNLRKRLADGGLLLTSTSNRSALSASRTVSSVLKSTTSKVTAPLLLTVFCLLAINIPANMLPHWPHHAKRSTSSLLNSSLVSNSLIEGDVDAGSGYYTRHLLWDENSDTESQLAANLSFFNSTMCPSLLNESESLRLESELRDWFDSKLNSAWGSNGQPLSLTPMHLTLPKAISSSLPTTEISSKRKNVKRRLKSNGKINVDKANLENKWRTEFSKQDVDSKNALVTSRQRMPSVYQPYLYRGSGGSAHLTIEPSINNAAATALVDGPPSPPSLLEVLQSRPDTYYVVSFSRDLLLVPAELHNSSSSNRPKMTLLLPAPLHNNENNSDSSSTPQGEIAMLQIDCEVLHTSLLNIADVVPPNLQAPNKDYMSEFKKENLEDISSWEEKDRTKRRFFRKSEKKMKNENRDYYNVSNTSTDPLNRVEKEDLNQTQQGFEDETSYSDEQFKPLYEMGHLDQVVDHPYRLHPKHSQKSNSKLPSGNSTDKEQTNSRQHDTHGKNSDSKKKLNNKGWLFGKN